MSEKVIVDGVRAEVQGRYLLRPAVGGGAAPLLVGFHGYAENAQVNLAAIEGVPGADGWHLASVQALHPFYNPRTRQVVASWMTSLDRELAIADNARYVAAAIEAIAARVEVEGPLAVLGFSQGTATAYRAAALSTSGCDAVVALGGDLPAELAEVGWRSRPRVLIGRGADDEWYDGDRLAADLARLDELGLETTVCRFDGGHEFTATFYKACGDFLRDLRAGSDPA